MALYNPYKPSEKEAGLADDSAFTADSEKFLNTYNRYPGHCSFDNFSGDPHNNIREISHDYDLNEYLVSLDQTLQPEGFFESSRDQPSDLLEKITSNLTHQHRVSSRQLAQSIIHRRQLAEKHRQELNDRLEELIGFRSWTRMLSPPDGGPQGLSINRQIMSIEKQKRDIQLKLWKDTIKLQERLLEERNLYQASQRRASLLSGGDYHHHNYETRSQPGQGQAALPPAEAYYRQEGG